MSRILLLQRFLVDLFSRTPAFSGIHAARLAGAACVFALASPLAADPGAVGPAVDPEVRTHLVARAEAHVASWETASLRGVARTFDAEGLHLRGETDGVPWDTFSRLVSFGREGALISTDSTLVRAGEHGAEVDHSGLREWVVASRDGLVRGFVLDQPPHLSGEHSRSGQAEAGSGDVLLNFELSGDLVAERSMDGDAVLLGDGSTGGRARIAYEKLTVVDAEGNAVPARMVVTDGGLQIRLSAFAAPYPLVVTLQVAEIVKLAPSSALLDRTGWSVDIDGDTAVVSRHLDEVGIYPNAGRVLIFERDLGGADNWGLRKEVEAPDPRTGEEFGFSARISGDTLVVGARFADDRATLTFDSGLVYVFERNEGGADNWGHTKTIANPTPAAIDWFGWAVDIDGDTLVASANAADDVPNLLFDSGAAYVFERDQGGAGQWGLVATLVSPDPQSFSYFARSVAISGDTVVTGTRFADDDAIDSGAAYVYERNLGGADAWGHSRSLGASDAKIGDSFGYDVAIDVDTIVVGAFIADGATLATGAAYVFERDEGGADQWGETRKLVASDSAFADWYGWAVAVDGDVILVGSYLDDSPLLDAGSTYVYRRDAGGPGAWGEVDRVTASDAVVGGRFGSAVALAGKTFVVGAENDQLQGAAYIFDLVDQADLSVSVVATPNPVAPGGSVTYTVTVTNNGPDPAENVVATGTFGPDAGTGSTTTGCVEDPNGAGSCTLGALASGASVQYTIVRPVDGGASGSLTLDTSVSASTSDPVPTNNLVQTVTTVSGGGAGSADLLLLKTDSADPVAPGATLAYSLQVLNNGPDDAVNVVLVDTLPAGVSGAVTTGCAESPGGVTGCSLGTITSGSSAVVTVSVTVDAAAGTTLDNTATVTSDTGDPAFANNTATESTNVGVGTADLLISMDDNADPINAGDMLTYTVSVANLSGDTATDVVVTTTLPPSVTSPSTVGCAEDPAGQASCSLGDIAAGSLVTFTLTVTTDPGVFDLLIAEAVVSSSTTDSDPASNTTTESTSVAAAGDADLWVFQRDSADPIDAGEPLTYTIWVGNRGPTTAQDVVLENLPPADLVGVTVLGCESGTLPLCGLGTLASNEIKVVTISGTLLDSVTSNTLTNEVSVSSANPDPVPADNTTLETTTIVGAPGSADLAVFVDDAPDPVPAGDSLVYTVQVVNLGPSQATAVTVASAISIDTAGATLSGCLAGSTVAACSLGALDPGVPVQFTITVPVSVEATGAVAFEATVASATADPEPANNTDMENTTITALALADLSVVFTSADATAAPGTTATYVVTVTNHGDTEATGVSLATTVTGAVGTAVTTGCAEDPAGVPACDLGTLAVGASATFTLEVPVNGGATGTVDVGLVASSDLVDPNPADNTLAAITEIEAVPPRVTAVGSVGDTGDGELAVCEEARVEIHQLLVTFNEAMDSALAADPASYRVVAAGADRDVPTDLCSTLEGDDVALDLAGVAYDDGSLTATLDLGATLADGPYRLLVCDTLTDAAGNALDGDENAFAGADFERYFRIETGNLFRNGHFDCDLSEWDVASTSLPVQIGRGGLDVDGASVSGSTLVYNRTTTDAYSLGQCVPMEARGSYGFSVALSTLDLETPLTVHRACQFFPQADCNGAPLSTAEASDVVTTVTGAGAWTTLPTWSFPIPTGSQSAVCSIDLQLVDDPTAEIIVLVDDAVLTDRIFFGGFETGDTSRWSLTVP